MGEDAHCAASAGTFMNMRVWAFELALKSTKNPCQWGGVDESPTMVSMRGFFGGLPQSPAGDTSPDPSLGAKVRNNERDVTLPVFGET